MASLNSRKARKEAEEKARLYIEDYVCLFSNIFHNSVKISGDDTVPKRYLLQILLGRGGIAYDKATQLYLPYTRMEIDVYGLPRRYQLIGFDGFNVIRKADEVAILRANDLAHPIDNYIYTQSKKLVDFDTAIEQNLEAVRTMTIAQCADQATLLTMTNMIESRRIGATVAFVNKNAMAGNEVVLQSTGAQYLVDKLQEARRKVWDETMERLGIASGNKDKQQRVQTSEIDVNAIYSRDMLNVLVDTFNYDAEYAEVPIRLEPNTEAYKYTGLYIGSNDNDVKEVDNDNI